MKCWLLEGERRLEDDRAFTHGLGVFETMLAVDGRLIRPDLHFERLATGCARLGIEAPDADGIRAALDPVLADLAAPRTRVRIMRTAGAGGLRELAGGRPATVMAVEAMGPLPDSVSVVTSPWPRNEGSPLAGVKCTSYAESLIGLDHARRAGVDELVFPNTRGNWCEAATANVFAVSKGVLLTPPVASGCLPGTARRRVMELAEGAGIAVREVVLPLDDARATDEFFLTSATRGVMPVSNWDDRAFADRRVTERLRAAFEATLEAP